MAPLESDGVQYSDLSTFFRVWLRLFLPREADWRYDPLASAVSEGDAPGKQKYGEVLGEIWAQCHRALDKEHGRLIFTFHHWDPRAWAELTLSLKRAGFVLMNRWVVFSENPASVHIRDLKALKHDVILVLKPKIGEGEAPQWPEPSQIDAADSHAFCRDCGAALGWFLSADVSEAQIRRQWRCLIEGDGALPCTQEGDAALPCTQEGDAALPSTQKGDAALPLYSGGLCLEPGLPIALQTPLLVHSVPK
jgi:putative DNA methylase